MRFAGLGVSVATAAISLILAACSADPKATDEELEEFEPPTVEVRGDVVPRQQRRFERLDRNKDGYATKDEIPARLTERVMRYDADGDGKVSRSEMVEGALTRFDRLDTNKDGQVTPEERAAGDAAESAPTAAATNQSG